jgi:ecotin
MKRAFAVAVFTIISAMFSAVQSEDNLKAYPPAEKGVVRHVVQLPKQDDESEFRVELIAGKTVLLDAANRYFFGGKIEEETIEGWGYPRYNLSKLGPMAGTLIGVDPNMPKVDRFVTLGGDAYLIRYNSRLPIVVYAPEGVEVRYRVWKAEAKVNVIEKG